MTRITMVIYSLDGGGAERVLVNLASGFLQRGHSVSVITLKRTADFYTLPEGTHRMALNVAGTSRNKADALYHNLRRIALIRRAALSTRPDVVIAFSDSTNVVTLLALTGTRIPVIITEHVDPAMLPPPNAIWRRLVRGIYPRAAKLVTVSKGVESRFDWLPPHQRQTIHNPLLLSDLDSPAASPCPTGKKCVMAMGRLVQVKGFDQLLEAFSRAAPRFPDWHLTILGEGELRPQLEAQIHTLGLAERVSLPGWVENPLVVLKQADLFVVSSRTESFSNALAEAMAAGVAAVSFDCPTGPREIIQHEVNGLLIPPEDVEALAAGMARLMENADERARFAAAGLGVRERFGLDRIVDEWEALIGEVIK